MHTYSNTLFTSIFLIMAIASCNQPKQGSTEKSTPLLQWSKLAELPPESNHGRTVAHPGLAGPVAGISNGYLIVGGGSNFPNGLPWEGGAKQYHQKLYLYQLIKTEKGDSAILSPVESALPYPLGYPACVSTTTGIIIAGGENQTGPLSKVAWIKLDTTQSLPKLSITHLPALPVASSGGMLTAMGNKIFFAGGNLAGGTTSSQFLLLDLNNTARGWQNLPDLPQPTSFGVLYADSLNHTLYLAGGRKSNQQARTTFYPSLFAFNTDMQRWEKKAALPYSASAATGVVMKGQLLFFGGDQGETFHQTEDLLLKIAAAKNSSEQNQLIAQKNTLQQHHPGFTSKILAYNPASDQWYPAGKLSFPSQVTTTAIAWQDKVIIPCGEIRAGIRYPDIIEGTLKSVL